MFGEFACILKDKIQYSIITAVPTEVIKIDRTNFMQMGKEKVEFFLQHSKMVPLDVDLRKALVESIRWSFFKN